MAALESITYFICISARIWRDHQSLDGGQLVQDIEMPLALGHAALVNRSNWAATNANTNASANAYSKNTLHVTAKHDKYSFVLLTIRTVLDRSVIN